VEALQRAANHTGRERSAVAAVIPGPVQRPTGTRTIGRFLEDWPPLVKIARTCQQVMALVGSAQDRLLPAADRARVQLHFVICKDCSNAGRRTGFLRCAVRGLDNDPTTLAEVRASPSNSARR